MKIHLYPVLLLACLTTLNATILTLETDKSVYGWDEFITVTLRLEETVLNPEPASSPGYVDPRPKSMFKPVSRDETSFTYRFRLRAGDNSHGAIGPYKMRIGDQELASNQQVVTVVPYEIKGAEMIIDRNRVHVGDTIILVLRYPGNAISNLRWRETALVTADEPSNIVVALASPEKEVRGVSLQFRLTATKPGELEISHQSFEGMPTTWSLAPIKLIIEP